jgi:hypothetical protein
MPSERNLRIGALFHLAGIIEADDLRQSLELANSEKLALGETLITLGFVRRRILEQALALQELIRLGSISSAHAITTLAYINKTESDIPLALKEAEPKTLQFLLQRARERVSRLLL